MAMTASEPASPGAGVSPGLLLPALYDLGFGILVLAGNDRVVEGLGLTFLGPLLPAVGMGSLGFGLLFLVGSLRPGTRRVVAGIGVVAKLGAIATFCVGVTLRVIPRKVFYAVLAGEILWLTPFALVAMEGSRWRPLALASFAGVLHVLACLGIFLVGPGTELELDMGARAAWVATHPGTWAAVWTLWALSSATLPGFLKVLLEGIEARKPSFLARLAFALATIGVLFDFTGEAAAVVAMPATAGDRLMFGESYMIYRMFSPALANGMYCAGGLVLSATARAAGVQTGAALAMGVVMWITGFGLSAAAIQDWPAGITVTGGLMMALFIPWSVWTGWSLSGSHSRPG